MRDTKNTIGVCTVILVLLFLVLVGLWGVHGLKETVSALDTQTETIVFGNFTMKQVLLILLGSFVIICCAWATHRESTAYTTVPTRYKPIHQRIYDGVVLTFAGNSKHARSIKQ